MAFIFADLVPDARPAPDDVFGTVQLDYKLVLNAVALGVFAALIALTVRRGATEPVCGMSVDRARAVSLDADGRTLDYCSEHCRQVHPDGAHAHGAAMPAHAPTH